MKHLENWKAWAIFMCVLVLGSLIIVSVGFQEHAPVIPKVAAQMGSMGQAGMGGYVGDILFSSGYQGMQYSAAPFNVGMLHPSSSLFPGPTIAICGGGGGGGDDGMTTLMTCSGCGMTMSTCDWNCGVTFSFCSPGGGGGGSTSVACTGMICSGGSTGTICGSVNTMGACTTGTICGGNTLLECSTGMSCGSTSGLCQTGYACSGGTTLGICQTGYACSSGGNTMVACTSMGCGGPGRTGIVCSMNTLMVSCTETLGACGVETLMGCPSTDSLACIGPSPTRLGNCIVPGPTAGAAYCGGSPTGAALYCGGSPTGGATYCGGGPTGGAAYLCGAGPTGDPCGLSPIEIGGAFSLSQFSSVGTNYSLSSMYQRFRAPGHSPAF